MSYFSVDVLKVNRNILSQLQGRVVLQSLNSLFIYFFAIHWRLVLQFQQCFFSRMMSSLTSAFRQQFSARAQCYVSLSTCGCELNQQIRTLNQQREKIKRGGHSARHLRLGILQDEVMFIPGRWVGCTCSSLRCITGSAE